MQALRVVASLLLVAVIAMLIYFPKYRENRAERGDDIAKCISSYVGYDVSREDWAWLETLPTKDIQTKVRLNSPHPENVIDSCLGRM